MFSPLPIGSALLRIYRIGHLLVLLDSDSQAFEGSVLEKFQVGRLLNRSTYFPSSFAGLSTKYVFDFHHL